MLTKKDSPKNETNSTKTKQTTTSINPLHSANDATNQSSCCSPNQACSTETKKTSNKTTKIKIKYDAGFLNKLYIRGKGAALSWDKGQLLKNISASEWTWETDIPFAQCEFKILMNDEQYEIGENHQLKQGVPCEYTPIF